MAAPVDIFVATTGIGMKAWFEAARALGPARRPAGRRSAAPRSSRAAPSPSERCAARACASCGRPSPSASRTCWRTCAAATLAGLRIVVQEHGQSLSMVAARPAPAGRRRRRRSRSTASSRAEDPEPMFQLVDLIADRELDAVTFTSAPAVAALMEAAGADRAPRRGRRRLPGRRGRHLRRSGDRRRLRAVGRADDPARPRPGWPRWSSCSRPSCRSRRVRHCPRVVGGHQLLLHGDARAPRRRRGPALAGAARRAPRAGRPTPATSSPAQAAARALPSGQASREHAVEMAVARLRAAIGTRLVQTVVKRGYRLAVAP